MKKTLAHLGQKKPLVSEPLPFFKESSPLSSCLLRAAWQVHQTFEGLPEPLPLQ
jgi:hypothetical protein